MQRHRYHGTPRNATLWALHEAIRQDKAIEQYFAVLGNRRRNNGIISSNSYRTAPAACRAFFDYLGIPVTTTALSELITKTKQQHKKDNMETDDALLRFASLLPVPYHSTQASFVKGVFKANRCPLQASFNTHFSHPTRKISPGVLKGIYDSLDTEHRAVMDFQAYAGERVSAICCKTALDQWEDFDDKYTLIHIKAKDTKARNAHICIVPKQLANWIRKYAEIRAKRGFPNTTAPFPNHETLWADITREARAKFGVHLTSHYLRKRFHTIAGKTPMPVNSWDYLMGDKPSYGHEAGTYTLEDFAELVKEYDKYLAPYLPIDNPREIDEPMETTKNDQLEQLRQENAELRVRLDTLTRLISERLTPRRARCSPPLLSPYPHGDQV